MVGRCTPLFNVMVGEEGEAKVTGTARRSRVVCIYLDGRVVFWREVGLVGLVRVGGGDRMESTGVELSSRNSQGQVESLREKKTRKKTID